MMGDTVIKVNNVSKKYNIYRKDLQKIRCVLFGKEPEETKYALTDVSFEVEKGERVAILGMLEAGRTTLLNVLSGVTYPSKGSVNVLGETNCMLNPRAGLEMEFSCRENIYLKGNVVGLTKEEVDAHLDEIIEIAEIKDYIDLPMKRAPKGAITLMSLAIHLIKDSDILISDDVFNGGGKVTKIKCEDLFTEYLRAHGDNVTIVMALNHASYVKWHFPRGIVLHEGKIAFDGPILEAIDKYREITKSVKAALNADQTEEEE